MMTDLEIRTYIEEYVAELEEIGVIKSKFLRDAFLAVPRHRLVESYYEFSEGKPAKVEIDVDAPSVSHMERLYSNMPIVTDVDGKTPISSASQPSIVAWMLTLLELDRGMKVLEIGAGTGYNAALMSEIIGDQQLVVSIDIQQDVIKRAERLLVKCGYEDIKLVTRDGAEGVAEEGPFDRIVATVGCPDLSPEWELQLSSSGFMLIPLMLGGWYPLVRVWKEDGHLLGKFVGDAGFMLMQGKLRDYFWPYTHGAIMSLDESKKHPPIDAVESERLPDFHKYLALSDRRTFCNYRPAGYGLYESEDDYAILVVETGETVSKGNKQLHDALLSYYSHWQDLGQPSRSDWIFEFVPKDREISNSNATMVFSRKMYQQVAWLL